MTLLKIALTLSIVFSFSKVFAQQPDFIKTTFPKGTILHQNIHYANDTLKKHLLDIYLLAKGFHNSASNMDTWRSMDA